VTQSTLHGTQDEATFFSTRLPTCFNQKKQTYSQKAKKPDLVKKIQEKQDALTKKNKNMPDLVTKSQI